MSKSPHRSFAQITRADLKRLARLGLEALDDRFRRRAYSRAYANRLLALCLCQGAARHYVERDRRTDANQIWGGVQDFDVWAFFCEIPDQPFPYRGRVGTKDFGSSKFGRNPDDDPRFLGRRIDVMGRSIGARRSESRMAAIQRYLQEGQTATARELAQRPVVVLWPDSLCGTAIRPPKP